ncbi:hypothetical protein F4813DRAFT_391052 [Daldinia decipiens]|uniref:uncharacterized protein n=1 Tax=Daldinia decipiens TaxID=326647 RepID=UPI0020C5AF4D|nr:uncharacterized protein F4813DRAFT_391052 [Daldinia decipiens]KAI1656069.1 hypothetical protein F4813DRAFT_391052 [Daldinia decipiens]
MASITTRQGRRCTAVPKLVHIEAVFSSTSASTSTSTSSLETSSSSSTLTSTSTSSSNLTSSSSSSSISSSTAFNAPPAIANPAQEETLLPPEIFPSSTSTIEAQPSADSDSAIPTALPAPAITGTDEASSSTALLIDTASTPFPTQPDAQVSSSAGQDDNPVQPTSSLFEQPVDSSPLTSSVENISLPTIGITQASSSSAETGIRGTELPSTQKAATSSAMTTGQTIAIAAGIAGGVMAISFLVFIIWFWRKRKQERRNSMLSPMSPRATFRDEKRPYLISRTSLGPTPLPEKLWATVEGIYRRLRGRVGNIVTRSSSPSPSVNLDRGNSQFGLPKPAHSRNNSNTKPPTSKDRPVDWWGRLTEDENSNWKLRRESKNDGPPLGLQPGRELEKAQGSGVNGNRRRSTSVSNEHHFLSGLGLDFDSADPFSDVNAIGNNTAKATPLVVSAANNPFSDSHAIGAPSGVVNGGVATYVQHSRHSHSHSVNGSISRQTSNASYRTSVGTVGTRRNRFRSDPFDLDRPDFLRSANSSMDATAGWGSRTSRSSTNFGSVPHAPQQAHVRNASFTSKYSSGVSTMDWSDPGPDIGPVVGRYTLSPGSQPERRNSDRQSGKSQGSVGKAL